MLTPDVERRLLHAVASGVPLIHAVTFAGIGQSTFHRWMQRGEAEEARVEDGHAESAEEAPYRQLWQQVSRARARVAIDQVEIVGRAAAGGYVVKERTRRFKDPGSGQVVTETETDYAPPEWQAARWLLEKSFHREFGRNSLEVTGADGGAVQVEHGVTPEVADLAARLAEFAARREPAQLQAPSSGDVIEGEIVAEEKTG